MAIILAVIGFIVAIYLVVLIRGHLATKEVMTKLKRDESHPEAREGNDHKNHFEDNSV
jgi:hypothetical protein